MDILSLIGSYLNIGWRDWEFSHFQNVPIGKEIKTFVVYYRTHPCGRIQFYKTYP